MTSLPAFHNGRASVGTTDTQLTLTTEMNRRIARSVSIHSLGVAAAGRESARCRRRRAYAAVISTP